MEESVNIVAQDIHVEWDNEESEYYTLIPIDNQTLRMGINVFEWSNTTIHGNIYISLYNKRKHRQHNEDNIIMTGRNPIKSVILGMRAFKELEKAFLEGYNEDYKVVISCNWIDNRRRDAYYTFLSKHGYRYGQLFGGKVIMKTWQKGEYKV